jgi:hypothetical protein
LWDSISKIPNKKRAGGVTTSSDPSTTHTHTHTPHTKTTTKKLHSFFLIFFLSHVLLVLFHWRTLTNPETSLCFLNLEY